MSHMVETMAYAGDVPWHGLGVPVSNDLTTDQMRDKAGLNWEVKKKPDYIRIGDRYKRSGTYKLVRDDTNDVLTTISEAWEHCTNKQAFDFFKEWVHLGDMEMHTAGSLDDGRVIWVLAKINDSFELFGGDKVDSYLLFSNPHMYGKSINIRFTPIRVVCNNTLTMSISQASVNAVRMNHRQKFNDEKVREMLGVAGKKMETYKSIAEFLGGKKASPENVVEYLKATFPGAGLKSAPEGSAANQLSKQGRMAWDAIETQPGAEFAEGSWWNAFNAVTYVVDHKAGRTDDSRLNSAWFGNGQRRKQTALETAIEFAEAA